jgi:hypothetical protein
MKAGEIVVVHLQNPSEKQWGVLLELHPFGITLRGLNVASFEDWVRSIVRDMESSLGLATVFFPMTRVERIALDERVGEVESMCESFERLVGRSVEAYLEESGEKA